MAKYQLRPTLQNPQIRSVGRHTIRLAARMARNGIRCGLIAENTKTILALGDSLLSHVEADIESGGEIFTSKSDRKNIADCLRSVMEYIEKVQLTREAPQWHEKVPGILKQFESPRS